MESRAADTYLVPVVLSTLQKIYRGEKASVLDIGCGNGYAASQFQKAGFVVRAFDGSAGEVQAARELYPNVASDVHSVYDDLTGVYGTSWDGVTSLEVIEHLHQPARLFEQSYRLLRSGGWLLMTTPYHGYLKNLALSLLDRWDAHFDVGWEGGHVKFFSNAALAKMARAHGFRHLRFRGIGRIPFLWKSTFLMAQK